VRVVDKSRAEVWTTPKAFCVFYLTLIFKQIITIHHHNIKLRWSSNIQQARKSLKVPLLQIKLCITFTLIEDWELMDNKAFAKREGVVDIKGKVARKIWPVPLDPRLIVNKHAGKFQPKLAPK